MTEEDLGRNHPERKERYRTTVFYARLFDRVEGLGNRELSMRGFDEFCCETVPMLQRVVGGKKTGFLTIEQVAEYYTIDNKTAYRVVSSGEVFAIKVGGQYRIPAGALILQVSVGIWHTNEQDKEIRLRAMQQGDLSILDTRSLPYSISNVWNQYAAGRLGTIPEGSSWNELIQDRLSPTPQLN